MKSSWIGISLLDRRSATRAAHSSRRTAASIAVWTATRANNNNSLSSINESLRPGERRTDFGGSATEEATL